MARIDGKTAAMEAVMEVTRLAAAAAYRAPQLTARLNLQSEIVTGEDQDPIIEFFREIAPISPVMSFDYQTLNYFREKGVVLPILLLGADLTKSELGWDCGACGFDTCSDFNAYSKTHRSKAMLWGGPTCNWKLMDFAAACDFACAAVAQNRLDCRAMGTIGAAAAGVGFLPEANAIIGIPIGPPGDLIYFSRKQNMKGAPYETQRECLMRTSPTNWQAFPGSTKPCIKVRQDWWNNMEYVKFAPLSVEEQQFAAKTLEKVNMVSQKHFDKVANWYKKEEQLHIGHTE